MKHTNHQNTSRISEKTCNFTPTIRTMSHLLSILLTLALIGILIYIIAENEHPVHTLAWVIAIVFLPVIGLILY
ncbi:MAG: hypothetical protein J6P46_08375, partial [Bacteroidales bacterium]|nr:hypothetical protein [Bacteroidales bacterium]